MKTLFAALLITAVIALFGWWEYEKIADRFRTCRLIGHGVMYCTIKSL